MATNEKHYPSREKPWMKYYPEKLPTMEELNCSVNEFLWRKNKEYLHENALNYYGHMFTFGELKEKIDETAKALLASGVKKGDIVIVCSVMTPETVFLFYAMNLIGVLPNMVDPRTAADGIHEYIEEVGGTFVVSIDLAYPKVMKAVKGTDVKEVLVTSPAKYLSPVKKFLYRMKEKDRNAYESDVVQWNSFLERAKSWTKPIEASSDPMQPSIMLHTGGTTGSPKCVVLSAQNMNATSLQLEINNFPRQGSFLDVMPPFIAYGFAYGVHLTLTQGNVAIILPNLVPEELGHIIMRFKPRHMAVTPLHWQTLARDPYMKGKDLSFLETTGCGGDALTEGDEIEVNEFLKAHNVKYPIVKGYGMTEISATAVAGLREHNKLGSCGLPFCMTNCSVVDPDTNEELGYNEEGEICFTGPGVMLGYYEKPEETANIMKKHPDGQVWLHTGDVGTIDEDGFVYVKSRIKRVIIRMDGFKIYNTAIEDVASMHPDVKTCSAVAMKDPNQIRGNLPALFFVPEDGETKSDEELIALVKKWCEEKLPEYCLPYEYIPVPELPHTPLGKVDYRALEKKAAELFG